MEQSIDNAVFERDKHLPAGRTALCVGAGNPEHKRPASDHHTATEVFRQDATID
jgi:hypothetical protein